MTHIEQLIKDLCPNGVPYKTFAELGTFYGGLSGKSKSDFQDGNAKYITYLNIGNNPALRLDILETVKVGPNEKQNDVRYGDALFTGSSETPDECAMSSVLTEHPTEKIYLNSFCFGFRFNSLDGICPAFYKHYFRSTQFRQAVRRTANGTTRFNVSKKEFAKLSIPIPPMEIQERIVALLDRYSALAAELQAELQLRRKQYEHYRTHLLTPHSDGNSADKSDDCNWVTSTLGEICENCYAGATPSTSRKDFWENGTIPWMSSGEVHQGHVTSVEKYITELGFQNSSTKWVPEDSVVIALAGQGKTRGCVALTKIRLCTNQSLCALIPKKDLILPEYLYQYLKTQYMQLRNVSAGDGTRGGLNLKMIREFPIVYPPLKEQARIVELLEKFDKLTMSMEEGIPAEQAAQQKRYEYFRDLLLTFDRKQV